MCWQLIAPAKQILSEAGDVSIGRLPTEKQKIGYVRNTLNSYI